MYLTTPGRLDYARRLSEARSRRWACVAAMTGLFLFSLLHGAKGQTTAQGTETARPMAADADPSFAVATVRRSDPDHPLEGTPPGHRTVFSGMDVRFLIAFAYDLHDKQIADAPAWLASEKFDITGVADTPGAPSLQQFKIMLQKLLVDRFQLRFHWETKEMSAYVLSVGKDGAKLDRSTDSKGGAPSLLGRPTIGMKGRNLTMTTFAQLLQGGILDRPVVNKTGLQGRYDFVLKWTPDESQFNQVGGRVPVPKDSGNGPPELFTAIQEQLGLKLRAEKTAVSVMVVDRVEQPSAN